LAGTNPSIGETSYILPGSLFTATGSFLVNNFTGNATDSYYNPKHTLNGTFAFMVATPLIYVINLSSRTVLSSSSFFFFFLLNYSSRQQLNHRIYISCEKTLMSLRYLFPSLESFFSNPIPSPTQQKYVSQTQLHTPFGPM